MTERWHGGDGQKKDGDGTIVVTVIMKEKMLMKKATNEIEAKITRLLTEHVDLTYLIIYH